MARVRLDSRAIERARRHLGGCSDSVIARLSKEIGAVPMGVRRGGSAFAYLARAILAQQISTAAARSIGQRMTDRWGWPWRPEQVLAASDDEMRALGLSRQKASYLRDLAAHTNNGLPLQRLSRMTDERVIETLTVVKGIGRWTAEMFLIFHLMRPNVLPLDDIGLITGISKNYFSGDPVSRSDAREVAAAWSPYCSVATWYIWRSLDPLPVAY